MVNGSNIEGMSPTAGFTARRAEEDAVGLGLITETERDTLCTLGVELYFAGAQFNRDLTKEQFMTVGGILRNLKDRTKTAQRLLRGIERTRKSRESTSLSGFLRTDSLALSLCGDSLRLIPISRGPLQTLNRHEENLLDVLFVVESQTRELERSVEGLEALMNDRLAREADFQDYFNRHPNFILTDGYGKAHPHIILTDNAEGRLIPDFILEPVDQGALCDVLELKLPSAPVFVGRKNRKYFSGAVSKGRAQLEEYRRFFDEEKSRQLVYEKYGLRAFKPKMILIIGKLGIIDPINKRSVELSYPDLHVRTYDELLRRENARIKRMKTGGINSALE
jgi:antiviral defense system Shedu protein SduA